nr:DUF6452 family protein [uncultured Flavobacterium sp.]
MKKTILLLLLFCFSFSGCEKDDICDGNTLTTPRMVITFYDISNPSVEKSVTNLSIFGDGMEEAVNFDGNTLINGSTVSIPLKVDADEVKFRFILNFGNSNTALINEDVLTFKYSRETIFVSRACGFKTNFTLDPISPFVHTDGATPDLLWIQYLAVEKYSIANENETHLKIYF